MAKIIILIIAVILLLTELKHLKYGNADLLKHLKKTEIQVMDVNDQERIKTFKSGAKFRVAGAVLVILFIVLDYLI